MIDGKSYKFADAQEIEAVKLLKTHRHSIEVVLDVVVAHPEEQVRIQEGIERALRLAGGLAKVIGMAPQSLSAPTKAVKDKKALEDFVLKPLEQLYSSSCMCIKCGHSFPELEPRFFSFNSPVGACADCSGLGITDEWPWKEGDKDYWKSNHPDFFGKYAKRSTCQKCMGMRLNKYALAVTIGGKNIFEMCEVSVEDALAWFNNLEIDETSSTIAYSLLVEISRRLQFLNNVGLSYLTLNRSARTLSGGEGQRIRLATQIGSSLSGVLYILDEPSIGLHQRDNARLIETLKNLRDLGNTVVVVEHDSDTMLAADYIIDMGPGAGIHGGMVTAAGTPEEVSKNPNSLTGGYLSGRTVIAVPQERRKPYGYLTLKHARKNNLQDLTVHFPLGILCGISGVSGSGKSTLIMEELVPSLERILASKYKTFDEHDDLVGYEPIQSLVVIDQSPIGRTSRSNPATYLGVFNDIRTLFSSLPDSNARGYKPGRFSFNCEEGRCFECRGDGTITISMHFLADVTITCKACKGKRYNRETLQILYRQKNIADVLEMTAAESVEFFSAHKTIARRLQLLCDVGLEYLKLGQSSTTLSGGEAQRIKLVDELAKRGSKTLYILDEPTTGLHSNDIERLLKVLTNLIAKGNSMIVIEHNLDVLKCVDYLIDLGPEGGNQGGAIVAQGTPEQVAEIAGSYTGFYLKKVLS